MKSWTSNRKFDSVNRWHRLHI